MDLGLSLNIATGGLKTIENELSTVSENVTNASTPGYVSETSTVSSVVVAGKGIGSQIGNTHLTLSQPLQNALYNQTAKVAGLTATNNSLSALSAVQGTTSGSDGSHTIGTLSDNLQNIATSLISLTGTPYNSAAQEKVISSATTLLNNIHTLSSVYQTQRQGAQNSITDTVSSINKDLTTIGQVSQKIMLAKSSHVDTADLENKRLEIMSDLSSKLGVTFSEKPNGDMVVSTQDGLRLPTRPDQIGQQDDTLSLPSTTWPLGTSAATLSPSMYHATDGSDKGVPDITLNGKDITKHLTDGTLGANIALRDNIYPRMQAQLDSFSYALIKRFQTAGLPLFDNGSSQKFTADLTKTAPDGLVGLSSSISLSQKYQNTPSLLTTDQQGNTGVTNMATQVINQINTPTNGKDGLEAPSDGLGPDGAQSTGYLGTLSLSQLATSLTTNQAGIISDTSNALTTATSIQTSLSTKVANISGVDVNSQMAAVIALKNSYTANAKVVSAVQSMFTALVDAIH